MALPDGTVVAGNHTLRAAIDVGWTHIATVRSDLTDAEVEAYLLADNRTGDLGSYDDAALLDLLKPYYAEDALVGTGYERDDVNRLLRELARFERGDPDVVPAVPAESKSQRGCVYELGVHRLMCGDATSDDDVRQLRGADEVRLVFTSPPYLDLREYHGEGSNDLAQLTAFFPTWANADLLAVTLGLVVRDGEIVRYWDEYLAAASAAGLKLVAWNVWNREEATNLGHQALTFPTWHEFVFVFGHGQVKPNRVLPTKGARTKRIGQRQADGTIVHGTATVHDRKALGSVLTTASHKGPSQGDHPAVFPVALVDAYIAAVTDYAEVVADPFAGSGTTLIAAENTGRKALLMEIDPAYCDVIRQRYADYTGQPEYAP